MSTPKAQFQVDHGSGWETIAEVDIIDGVAYAPNAWAMVRALGKQIVYIGCVSEEITTVPSSDREAFEKAITVEGLHTNLTRIGPADSRAGEYAHTIVQTCWEVWQRALAYCRERKEQ